MVFFQLAAEPQNTCEGKPKYSGKIWQLLPMSDGQRNPHACHLSPEIAKVEIICHSNPNWLLI